MIARPQWVVWKSEQIEDEPKPRKVPYDAKTMRRASTTDPATWADFATVQNIILVNPDFRPGFVFADDPYLFIDLDGCRDPETGEWTADALQIMGLFPGAAMEVSISGTGGHIVGRVADKTAFANRRRKWAGQYECYATGRFMALNSLDGWNGNAETDITDAALAWVPEKQTTLDGQEIPVGRDPRWCGPEDDDELLSRILNGTPTLVDEIAALTERLSHNPNDVAAFAEWDAKSKRQSRRERVKACFSGNEIILGANYPDTAGNRPYDASAADMALMNDLAFWTGNDAERMLRLFERSHLAKREKWIKRKDYQQFTLRRALGTNRDVYSGTRIEQRQKQSEENVRFAAGFEYSIHTPVMDSDQMIKHLYFIRSGTGGGAVANVENGKATTFGIARNDYAASKETITVIDGRNGKEKQKTVSTFEMWLNDPRRLTADRLTWNPDAGSICDVPGYPGTSGFNTWKGLIEPKLGTHYLNDHSGCAGWLSAWNEHLEYLIPIENERRLFEQWLAHIVQRPGDLPQTGWCLIAGNTGIGRNWLGSVLHRVIRGHVLGNAILDTVLAGDFNGLMSSKLLIVVDEARAGMRGANTWQHSEKLKTTVNPEFREINEKCGLQRTEHNKMRWLVFSNHWDALPIERDDRRWNIVANPTERKSAEYYNTLYQRLYQHDFIAAVWAHLSTVSLQGFRSGALPLQNDARSRMLEEIETETERTMREFREIWPAPVAQFKDVEAFIRSKNPTNTPARHVIERDLKKVGMTYCRRAGKHHTRFIITGDLQEDAVRGNAVEWLQEAIDAAAKFQLQPQFHQGE